jgi:1,4-dihydroxy-2-naphthoate polyprenyltransferase
MNNLILAMRPKTLLASFIPPLVSFIYFQIQSVERPYLLLISCLISALCIQIATNFFNDVIDFKKGADNNRKGPTRVTASGLIRPEVTFRWAISFVLMAVIAAIPVLLKGGWPYALLGLISLYLSYGYTGGPLPLAYKGLGEIFVFLFFGLFSILGSYYLFSSHLNLEVLILAIMYGCLTTTFICINNLRDKDEDKKVGKLTLATKISAETYKFLTLTTIFLPYILLHFFKYQGFIYLTFLALIPAIKLSKIVLFSKDEELNLGLKFSGIHLVVFSFLFLISIHL